MLKHELNAQIKLSALKDMEIVEVNIQTKEGMHSDPISFSSFSLKGSSDTTISLNFNPFNNQKLYQITGMQGNLRDNYIIGITYRMGAKVFSQSVNCVTDKNEYVDYIKKHTKPLTGYSLNTKTDFNESQKKYLETLKDIPKPPFVFLSDQEIAVSGLNFRLTSHYLNDTLYAGLSIVNHAEFQVKILPDNIDISTDKPSNNEPKTITIEKISGNQQFPYMIEKGDRILLHFKKYIKLNSAATQNPRFHIKNSFILKGNIPLFNQDIQLIPHQF